MKSGRRHGFLCQSHASTAVCIPGDSRAVIVPRRPDRSSAPAPKLVDLKYSRLVGSGRYSAGCTGSDTRPLASNVLANVRRVRPSATAPPPPPRPPTTLAMAPAAVETGKARKDVTLIPAPSRAPAVTTYGDVFQVVVMRVSIHCQGCAYKVKKHISKMEGVTSFSIDLEKKRVTVMGHISPLGVLESISKVKKAEFWQG